MSKTKIDFATLPWQQTQRGARFKSPTREGKQFRLLELTSEFVEPDWCLKSHAGYVVEGEMEITFADRTENLRAAMGFSYAAATGNGI